MTTDVIAPESHGIDAFPLPGRSRSLDPLTRILQFLDHAVSNRDSSFAMHLELRAPRGISSFDSRCAFDRFLAGFFGDLELNGYAPFCAWSFARTSHAPMARLLLLLDGSRPNSIGTHLRAADHAWGVALGIADANRLVGYRDHTEMDGNKIGNDILIDSGAEGIDANWTDCFRIAELLVDGEEGEAPASPAIGFHGTPLIALPQD